MRFGPVPLGEAEGAVLAHSIRLGDGTVKKGTRLGPAEIARLREAGFDEVVVAVLGLDDVPEDEAAGRIAAAAAGPQVRVDPPFTGRSNLHAETAGILVVGREAIDRLNRIDESLTIATWPAFAAVEPGRMVGTVKVIPYAVPGPALEEALSLLRETGPVLRVAPYRPRKVGMIATVLPGLAEKVLDKTARVLADRLAPAGASILSEQRVPHETEPLVEALSRARDEGAELLVVFGASAIADRRDVIPAALVEAGGRIEHFGMPVDPGNLLLIGDLGGVPVIGAPGCARSPKENGFDWVLGRMLADVAVTREDITGMGVGGLLMEIVTRPQPREGKPAVEAPPRVAALVLAAGQSRRMGGPNKLLATLDGEPLVRLAAEAACRSGASSVTVVTGHRAEDVRAALDGLDVAFTHNPDYEEGLATSLKAGIAALPEDADAVIVCLADMPGVTSSVIDRVIVAYAPAEERLIVVPTHEGKRGNPVLWSRRFFDALAALHGDVGARHLIGENAEAVTEIEIGEAVSLDLDTPEAMRKAGGVLGPDLART